MKHPTIFALSSGPGVAGVAVVRVSGSNAFSVLQTLTKGAAVPQPRRASLRALRDPQTGDLLDQALVLTFKGPASFTGEDVVELHLHGGRAVVKGVLSALDGLSGTEPAAPGDFTRRAFEAGKLDLTAVEGLGDLLHAETTEQRRLALKQMGGALADLYESWRDQLVRSLAYLEADIDFPDEDLPDGVAASVLPGINSLRTEMLAHLSDDRRGERVRDGYRVAIVGAPNAGKSTLLNALAGSDVAIVTDEAGTTRDVLEVRLDLGGYPVRLFDTAGIRDGDIGLVEAEGIRRAVKAAEEADACLIVHPAGSAEPLAGGFETLAQKSFLALSKADLGGSGTGVPDFVAGAGRFTLSAKTGEGLDKFLDALTHSVSAAMSSREAPVLTRLRHRRAVEDCAEALKRFETVTHDAVLAAEEVRLAARSVARITGRVDVEDLLDVIFRDFCIGK